MARISLTLDPVTAHIASLIPDRARVLGVGGSISTALLRLLRNQGCRVTIVTTADGDPDCDTIIRGSIAQDHVRGRIGDERYDAVIVSDLFADGPAPPTAVKSALPYLADEGLVVAAVPNPGNGAMASVAGLMLRCGLAVAHIDPVQEPIASAAVAPGSLADLRTSHFVVAAFPLPDARLKLLGDMVRAFTHRGDATEREARALSQTRADLEQRIALFQKQQEIREGAIHAARERAVRQQEVISGLQAQVQQQLTDAANRQAVIDRLQSTVEQQRLDLSREIEATRAARRQVEQIAQQQLTDAATSQAVIDRLQSTVELQRLELSREIEATRAARTLVEQIARSYSWRITAPLRAVRQRLSMKALQRFTTRR